VPLEEDIDIVDIAHALSMLVRFNGHCLKFYSVAEHSVHVSKLVAPAQALWGLLHDASEAYLGDVPTPLKKELVRFKELEQVMMEAIARRFQLDAEDHAAIKKADIRMLRVERNVLMVPPPKPWPGDCEDVGPAVDPAIIKAWGPEEAKARFLARFAELSAIR
jgi:hypothetical protein